MNQVKRGIAPFEVVRHGFGIREICFPNFHVRIVKPLAGFEFARRAHEASYGVARIQQTWRETSANVAGGSRNCDS
jgi:hypothetical protein